MRPVRRIPGLLVHGHQQRHRVGLARIDQIQIGIPAIPFVAGNHRLRTILPHRSQLIPRFSIGEQGGLEMLSVEPIDLIVFVSPRIHQ